MNVSPVPVIVPIEAGPLTAIGCVRSAYTEPATTPRQAEAGAAPARLVFAAAMADGLRDIRAGDTLLLLTWLDRARRDVLTTRPQDNPAWPERGVFSTRSPHRPNPIGLHRVTVTAVLRRTELEVDALEAFDGTPILDVKPLLPRSPAS